MQPILQIRQTSALLGMESSPGYFSITQPQAELRITTTPGEWDIQSHRPELNVDQSRAFAAYNGGKLADVNNRIYSGLQQIYLQGIANRVEQGNRMVEFFKPGNSIAEVYGTDTAPNPFPETRGPASYDNVDIHFSITPTSFNFRPANVNIEVQTHRPETEYIKGKLDLYVQQYASIQFIPPELNIET